MMTKLVGFVAAASSFALLGEAFSPSFPSRHSSYIPSGCQTVPSHSTVLCSTGGGSGGSKKKRRRRKQPVTDSSSTDAAKVPETSSTIDVEESLDELEFDIDNEEPIDIALIKDVAKFKFDGDISAPASSTPSNTVSLSTDAENTMIPLPDIKEVLRKKEIEEELARIEEEQAETKVKIKRSDRKALAKLLEQQPYADADDSFFEEEEYGTVSALLGERALPFLGIPTGPLQVGHFIGALVIVLMAFVEYPGFPLTNLPSPLRGALQGGLLTVYSINTVLAVMAVFKANERGQPAGLWVAKCFTVGGIAFDQLTQLPTLEQIEKAKARKGKRALKKK